MREPTPLLPLLSLPSLLPRSALIRAGPAVRRRRPTRSGSSGSRRVGPRRTARIRPATPSHLTGCYAGVVTTATSLFVAPVLEPQNTSSSRETADSDSVVGIAFPSLQGSVCEDGRTMLVGHAPGELDPEMVTSVDPGPDFREHGATLRHSDTLVVTEGDTEQFTHTEDGVLRA